MNERDGEGVSEGGGALLIQLDEFSVNIMDHRYKYRVFFNNNSKKNIESG